MSDARREILTIFLLLISVALLYCPPRAQENSPLQCADYVQLHERRMQFARDAIFGPDHKLPAWYPRELLGTPFWSNIQNFPFIPTRLLITLTLDPTARWTYPLAAILSADLAALFTFFYLRRLNLGLLASFVGGWTFACSGFYASRFSGGQLPLLEAYLALPLLLWTIESFLQTKRARWILAIGVSSACVALAGHPQLPIYALAGSAIYAIWRGGFRSRLRGGIRACIAMTFGVGCASFALIPMLMLIGRSTRILSLAPADNDISLPYPMLLNFFLPWRNGHPPPVLDPSIPLFHGYPNSAYFWDTFCYIGLAPWIAVLGLLAMFLFRRRAMNINFRVTIFLIAIGLGGALFALPIATDFISSISNGATLLRSPARMVYFTEFALAAALAAFVQQMIPLLKSESPKFLLAFFVLCHGADLVIHDRAFVLNQIDAAPTADESAAADLAATSVGDGRAAFDYVIPASANRTVDDIGTYDSILLSRTYQFLIDAAGAQGDVNVQMLDGWQLSPRALKAAGVSIVVSTQDRPDLEKIARVGRLLLFRVYPTEPRAQFFPLDQVRFGKTDEIRAALRDEATDLSRVLMLPGTPPAQTNEQRAGNSPVKYLRPSPDRIECDVSAARDGYLRVIESFDPGWSAAIDGKPVPTLAAWNALLCTPVPAGMHHVVWIYRTPGARIGLIASLISALLLIGFTIENAAGNRYAGAREGHES